MQQILFPMQYLNITTGINQLTHVGSNAIDNAGQNTGIDNVFAPYDGIIKKIWNNGNSVWLESVEPVQFADGTVDYATSFYTHDNNVSDLSVGQRIPQGVSFYQEGTAGNATGNHVHMEIAKGKFTKTGWFQNAQGYWVLYNSVAPWTAFFLKGTIIINNYGYPWVKDEEDMPIPDEDNYYYRYLRSMQLLRGRDISGVGFSRDEFRTNFVGNTDLRMLESMSDDIEANTAHDWMSTGYKAINEQWERQLNEQIAANDTRIASLKAVRVALGLPEIATDQQVEDKIKELEAIATAPPVIVTPDPTPDAPSNPTTPTTPEVPVKQSFWQWLINLISGKK